MRGLKEVRAGAITARPDGRAAQQAADATEPRYWKHWSTRVAAMLQFH